MMYFILNFLLLEFLCCFLKLEFILLSAFWPYFYAFFFYLNMNFLLSENLTLDLSILRYFFFTFLFLLLNQNFVISTFFESYNFTTYFDIYMLNLFGPKSFFCNPFQRNKCCIFKYLLKMQNLYCSAVIISV